ncbi:MAG: 2-oxoacid:ferredoxin oxidoreductase subunit beta [Gammaproteobacteria bacterium]|nr:2-oxoacid:ferredoxin oxidoreductase subunit beta [Gammaproteobacteria bacterium]MDH3766926.1 2-oxoacid:ferredoxin oxidoreductase subunit beta [Gammaproteobacteria bacterium]
MSFIRKPNIAYKGQRTNALGLSMRDYEGGMSTLCAGCGHDSITSALVQAFFELDIEPHRVAKLSGIGCSSKTPAYFLSTAHGINTVHGRMPAVATGANAAARDLYYIGVSGDGDSLSIGLGQFAHAMRRNLHMLYLIENNGVYGLTKGQFSASADLGTKAKKGEVNEQPPIDPVKAALAFGGSFVARAFSGDKDQLLPLLKAGLKHKGFAMIDVLSPCVTFNDHEDSTKSYAHTRQFYHPAVHTDFIPPAEAITINYAEGDVVTVELHDGSKLVLCKVQPSYDPHDRAAALSYLEKSEAKGEIVTGLLYIDENRSTMHAVNNSAVKPLREIPYEDLNPGAAKLVELQSRYR